MVTLTDFKKLIKRMDDWELVTTIEMVSDELDRRQAINTGGGK